MIYELSQIFYVKKVYCNDMILIQMLLHFSLVYL